MATVGVQDENRGELLSPGGKGSRKRKMEERDENSLGEPEDFEWENSKENVMPLKRGRIVNDLNRALRAAESFQGKTKVEREAKEMEARVHEYTGNDPLSVWVQYVKWIETNMPEDTRRKFAALEKCTRALMSHAEYKNDIRYIRLWIQYADLVSNPKDIFKFLYVNKIGERVSLFYVGWAMVLESVANYAQAHKVYLKATQKKAEPDDLLDRKYKEFQRRMSRHWLKVSNGDPDTTSADENQRFALEDITTDGASIQRFGNSENFRRYAQAQAEKMQRANAHKPVFTVYEDPTGSEVDRLPTNTNWKRLDTVQHQNKENDTVPGRWNDGPLHPSVEHANPVGRTIVRQTTTDSLQVFVDPEFTSTTVSIPSLVERDRSHALRQRLEGVSTEEEQLLKQPLKNFTNSNSVDKAKPPRAAKLVKPAEERYMYDERSLKTDVPDDELCFEELRARKFVSKSTRRLKAQEVGRTPNRFLAQPVDSVANQVSRPPMAERIAEKPILKSSSFVRSSQPGHAKKEEVHNLSLQQAEQEDMTINTRLAMEDVNSMFCSPSREQKEPVVKTTIWEVPEPVERKLHFSVFEDSVDSIALNPNETSLRNDAADQNSFQVYADEDLDRQPKKNSFLVFPDEAPQQPPRTASKMTARKPLTAREDLGQGSRMTNKDIIMRMQTDSEAKEEEKEESSAPISIRDCQSDHEQEPPMSISTRMVTTNPSTSNPILNVPPKGNTSEYTVNPYDPALRRATIESARVCAFARVNTHLVFKHSTRTPMLWTTDPQRRKLKRPIFFRLSRDVAVEAIGFLGSGGFAQVFSARVKTLDSVSQEIALKCEKRSSTLLWELYVAEKLRIRANSQLLSDNNVPMPRMIRLDIFQNGAMLLMEKAPSGTLHDLVNMYKKECRSFPELLVMHYTIRMLYALEFIHEANILHGDIKPDNWVLAPLGVNDHSMKAKNLSSVVSRSGNLHLIDFGRSIDLDHFPPHTTFISSCHAKGFQSVEMLTKRPWSWQIDTFGVCATVHFLLFGEYMDVVSDKYPDGSQRFKPRQGFKRYWQVGIWSSFFEKFMNIKSCDSQPSLPSCRRQLERFFYENPHRQKELRELLACQDRMLVRTLA